MFGLKQEHIHSINRCFAGHAPIKEVILYGSRAKGTYRPGSDIDLTILEEGLEHSDFLKLLNEIDDLMLPYKIDLSLKREIDDSNLLHHIDRVGKVFYESTLTDKKRERD